MSGQSAGGSGFDLASKGLEGRALLKDRAHGSRWANMMAGSLSPHPEGHRFAGTEQSRSSAIRWLLTSRCWLAVYRRLQGECGSFVVRTAPDRPLMRRLSDPANRLFYFYFC